MQTDQDQIQGQTQNQAQDHAQDHTRAPVNDQPQHAAPVQAPDASTPQSPPPESPAPSSPSPEPGPASPAESGPAPEVNTPEVSTPEAPPPEVTPSDADAMDAAMQAAMAGAGSAPTDTAAAEAEAHQDEHQQGMPGLHPAKPKLRGPRVVEGGREHRTGYVVSVGPTDIFVEFGPKELGVVERAQFKDKQTGEEKGLPATGEQLSVVVQRFDPSENIFICILPGSIQKADWEMLTPGQDVEAKVTGTNKGGLELEVAGHRAFMPASQVDVNQIKDLSVYVGEKITCRVQRIDRRGKGNIVLSRRELLAEERAEQASKLKDTLKEGETVEGTVRKIMDFGAFVDLGGVDGLVHIADISHDRVNHGAKNVSKYVTEGQTIRVQVLKVDWDANRISLGLKQLQSDPFEAAASEVVDGAELTGKVTKILEFGAFVEVAPGVEGLVHISELDHRRVNKVEEVVQEDEVVQVKVLKIDPDTRKVSLSIKALKDAPPPPKGSKPRGAGGGGGRGRGDRDTRSPDEILKETPQLRRMREEAKKREAQKQKKADKKKGSGVGGLGDSEVFGTGLGDLRL